MVGGLDKFRETFSRFSDCFVIIGGTACDEILQSTSQRPRATLDIDIIVIAERMTSAFAKAFWQFIDEGGYRPGIRMNDDGTPKYVLYSFNQGKPGFPVQIELLSRHNEIFYSSRPNHIEPLPIGEDVSSLSAIILDKPYYDLTIKHSFVSGELRFASPIALMALKARAYLNLINERREGRRVNTKDILKHRNDVMKLVATAIIGDPVQVSHEVIETINDFVSAIRETLPSQSLRDALRQDNDVIDAYLDILTNFFTEEQ